MLFVGYDIETTGLEIGDHRIIEIGIGLWRPADPKPVLWYEKRIDPQRSIAADAQRVHGISIHDLVGKPLWDVVAPDVQKIMAKGTHHVAHNGAGFDAPFVTYEMKRVGLAMPKRPMIDTMLEGIWATPDGKKPSLKEFCFACGVDYDETKAHAARYDVEVMMAAFMRALAWGYIKPETVSIAE